MKLSTITYPDSFPSTLKNEINELIKSSLSQKDIKLLKKIVENKEIQLEVFPTLLKLKEKPNENTSFPGMQIAIYLSFCLQIHNHSISVKPLPEKKHRQILNQILKNIKRLKKDIEILRNAGELYAQKIKCAQIDTLTEIEQATIHATRNEFTYTHGNLGMPRKKEYFRNHYFITRLHLHMLNRYSKPLHKVIAITTNVIFDLNELYDENNVQKITRIFKKHTKLTPPIR